MTYSKVSRIKEFFVFKLGTLHFSQVTSMALPNLLRSPTWFSLTWSTRFCLRRIMAPKSNESEQPPSARWTARTVWSLRKKRMRERPQLPNGIPGQWTDFNLCVFVNQNVNSCILKIPTHVDRDCGSLHFFKKTFFT